MEFLSPLNDFLLEMYQCLVLIMSILCLNISIFYPNTKKYMTSIKKRTFNIISQNSPLTIQLLKFTYCYEWKIKFTNIKFIMQKQHELSL